MGGLARRASYVRSVRERETNVILLDVGNVFGDGGEQGQRQAEMAIKAMELMNYDALNLGRGEFLFGRSFLEEQRESASFPFLSANLVAPDPEEHPYAAYVVKEAGHLKVGIVGLVWPEPYPGREPAAQDPTDTLKALLPQVKEQAHFVVVLAQVGYARAVELIHDVEGIDVVIIGDVEESVTEPLKIDETLLVECTRWGMAVGELQITGNTDGKIVDYQWRNGILDQQIADDPQVVELMRRYGQ